MQWMAGTLYVGLADYEEVNPGPHPGAQLAVITGPGVAPVTDPGFVTMATNGTTGKPYFQGIDQLGTQHFTQDYQGNALGAPVDMLVAGFWTADPASFIGGAPPGAGSILVRKTAVAARGRCKMSITRPRATALQALPRKSGQSIPTPTAPGCSIFSVGRSGIMGYFLGAIAFLAARTARTGLFNGQKNLAHGAGPRLARRSPCTATARRNAVTWNLLGATATYTSAPPIISSCATMWPIRGIRHGRRPIR